MRRFFGAVLCAMFIGWACGSHSGSPTSPSGSSSTTATINGTVLAGTASALLSATAGASISGLTVTVVGTSISSAIDAVGRFTLMNVPPGSIQLRISGAGTDATVPLNAVQAAQTITIVLVVSGATASVDSDVRSIGSETELEGRIESLPPSMPALTFKAAGRTVKTDASTQFVQGSATRSFSDLEIGMRVHARGTASGDTLMASKVEIQNTNTELGVEINGVVAALTGTAASFQFEIAGRKIHGDATTTFFGDGNNSGSFSSLHNGVRVEVKGEQRDGFVFAIRIHVNGPDDDGDDDEDSSASIHGTLKSIDGTKPNLTLLVDTTTVHTSSNTEVKRRGDVQTLDSLKTGQSLHVVGERQADSSINARKIEIDDDEPGGEFEIEGSLGGLSGTCPAIHFSVNGFQIIASASTTFDDVPCTALKNGDRVKVNGTRQSEGPVAATKIKRS